MYLPIEENEAATVPRPREGRGRGIAIEGGWGRLYASRMRHRLVSAFVSLFAIAMASGCTQERARATPTATATPREYPSILRGTIGSEVTLRGAEPVLVSGYGIVVGLNGTGSSDPPEAVRSWMEREMSLRGVGQGIRGMADITPREMIDDLDTAVVFVQAAIAPGAPEGANFDVLVTALPGTSVTSLEGGTLWTTDLTLGIADPSGPATQKIAQAKGPIFINPFVDPAKQNEDAIVRTAGRILNGGVVTDPLEMLLVLDTPSHSRARAITTAINTQFPRGARDRNDPAVGRDDESIALSIPARFRDDAQEFMQLLLHTRIDQRFPQEWAVRYTRALTEQIALTTELGWCLQAIGRQAVPHLRELYEYPEILPRLTALRAAARLGDALVVTPLLEIAARGSPALRVDAIELLADLPPDPQVNLALRELLDDDQLDVRIAAYEALAARRDPMVRRENLDGKFILDTMPIGRPMIYISQQREPRIAVIGSGLELERPTLIYAWEDRLIVASDSPTDDVRVMYTDHRTGEITQARTKAELTRFIEFLAHTPTPEAPAPGLALSYSETVGALYELTARQDAINAEFIAEQDRLQAELLTAAQTQLAVDRPELEGEEQPVAPQAPTFIPPDPGDEPSPLAPARKKTYVVPLNPAPTKGNDDG